MKNFSLIAVTGFAQSGKDSIVNVLSELGYQRLALADKVREGIYGVNPYVLIFPDEEGYNILLSKFCDIKNNGQNLVLRLQEIVDFLGWDEAKKIREVRRLLQNYGTEGGRDIFGNDIWTVQLDKLIVSNNYNKVAISDLRFLDEVDWIKSKPNNFIIKVKRPNVTSVNSHSSDAGIPDELCNIIINNDKTLKELKERVKIELLEEGLYND